MTLIKFFERKIHRGLHGLIYKSINVYRFTLIVYRYINFFFLPPHEEDIYGLNYLKLNEKRDIIDVGASDGVFFKGVKSIGIKNKFIAFEPVRAKHFLSKVKKKNKNFKYYDIALGNRTGTLTLYMPNYNDWRLYNWSSYSKNNIIDHLKFHNFNVNLEKIRFKKIKIKQRKLDFFKLKPTLIKIDVEGYENKVLLGAMKTIKKYKPAIYVENNLLKGKYNTVNFFKKKLLKFGYKPYVFKFEKKSFLKFNEKYFTRKRFLHNVFFITKKHFIIN